MTHVRQQIRAAAATALKSGTTDAGDDVYPSLVFPSDQRSIPLIYVHFDEEDSERISTSSLMNRVAVLVVTAIAQVDELSLDDDLDQMAAQIEAIIGGNLFGGLAKATDLVRTEINRSPAGKQATGEISLSFEVAYQTANNDGETAL